jgi:hypothetical protein
MPTVKVKYTQPLLGRTPGSLAILAVTAPDSVLIRQDGVACSVFADNAGTALANPVPIGVAEGAPGVDTTGNLTVFLNPGNGYDGVATEAGQSTRFPIPDISLDSEEPIPAGTIQEAMLAFGVATQAELDAGLATREPTIAPGTFALVPTPGTAGTALTTGGVAQTVAKAATFTGDFLLWSQNTRYDVKAAPGADNNAKLIAALDAAAAEAPASGGADVYFHEGDYSVDKFTIPPLVNLLGAGENRARLINRQTNGGVFVLGRGSFGLVAGLHVDGKRANQPVDAGLSAIQYSKPNAGSGGGSNIAGGLLLSAAPAAGATSVAVSSATFTNSTYAVPVMPGEAISFVEGANYEIVRVARSYTPGATTIPLETPLLNAYTVAAQVAVFITDVLIEHNTVFGCGRDGIALWHAFASHIRANRVFDCSDTAIDLPSGGSRDCSISDNYVETNGRWCIALDTAETNFGRTSEVLVNGNIMRMLNGGTDAQGTASTVGDCIYLGNVDRPVVTNNVMDCSRSGISGVRLVTDAARHCLISANEMVGGLRAGTAGIRHIAQAPSVVETYPTILGNAIRDFAKGIDLDDLVSGIIDDNTLLNNADYGININAHGTAVQKFSMSSNRIHGGVANIRCGGTPAAGSTAFAKGNVISGASFTPVIADAGWTLYRDDSPVQVPNTSGATLAQLEGTVNEMKAAMRINGVLAP